MSLLFLHRRLGNLHPDVEAYENTLAVFSIWSDPCGTREEMVMADGLFEE
jgi:hypothetical protein